MKTMMPRGPHEPHRTATPLELFFDLAYVVPIAQAGLGLHHAKAEGAERRGTGITSRSGYSLLGGAISIILPAAAALILASACGAILDAGDGRVDRGFGRNDAPVRVVHEFVTSTRRNRTSRLPAAARFR